MRVELTDAQERPLLAIEGEVRGHALRIDGPPVRLPDGTLGVRVVNSWGNPDHFGGHSIVRVQAPVPRRHFTWGRW